MKITEQAIINYLSEHETGTAKQISRDLDAAYDTTCKYIRVMSEKGKIFFVGKDKDHFVHWSLSASARFDDAKKSVVQLATDFIAANPGTTNAEIARELSVGINVARELLSRAVSEGKFCREMEGHIWRYWTKADYARLPEDTRIVAGKGAELFNLVTQAETLEKKGFWRRAKDVWVKALDIADSGRAAQKIRTRIDIAHKQATAKTKYWAF